MAEPSKRGGRDGGAIPCLVPVKGALDVRSGGLGSNLGLQLPCCVTLGQSPSFSEPLSHQIRMGPFQHPWYVTLGQRI